jgi:DNA-binding response OmpR family regulator
MSHKVLVVDDEHNILLSIEFLLKQAGYQVEVAHDGEEAMEKMRSFQPSLVLLDVMMPKVNGFEVSRRIRENPEWSSTKIIMLTAKGREVEVTKGLALGADSYVIKPFSTRDLMAEVKNILSQ